MRALPPMVTAICVVAIAYRYYSAFLAAKVLVLDDTRATPAHRFEDGQNYVPTKLSMLLVFLEALPKWLRAARGVAPVAA